MSLVKQHVWQTGQGLTIRSLPVARRVKAAERESKRSNYWT
jgi:hypothetical protein